MDRKDNNSFIKIPWVFDENVAKNFDLHVRKSIPFYDEIHRIVIELSEIFLSKSNIVCDLGTATGEAVWNLWHYHKGKDIKYFCIDSSLPMLNKAKDRLAGKVGVNFINAKIEQINIPPSDYIICIYTLHFVPLSLRNIVINNVFKSLNRGGGFLIGEKIKTDNIILENAFRNYHITYKASKGLPHDEITQKAVSIEGVLIPLTLDENLSMLRDAGFKTIEIFFKWYNFVGIIAIK